MNNNLSGKPAQSRLEKRLFCSQSWRLLLFLTTMIVLFLSGCSSIGKIANEPAPTIPGEQRRYSFKNHVEQHGIGDVFFIIAFSGGGTRAAALSYGVLEELRDTTYEQEGEQLRLLDEIDRINGVSGGSFTASYYGLFGEETFADFKKDFLYKDIESELTGRIFNVFNLIGRLFTSVSRTEEAISVYDEQVFRGKTFADLQASGNPFILINATDLNAHDLFVFSQDYFDFLCSDLSQLQVARAAAASSAVPVLFDPVLIQNHKNCAFAEPAWLTRARRKAREDSNLRFKELVKTLDYYLNPANPPYLTLVDGGVTDNLGLRAILNNVMLFEGTEDLDTIIRQTDPIKHVVVLVVNASTTGVTDIGKTTKMPTIADVLTAVTDIQLHRYNLESNSLLKGELKGWAESISRPNMPVEPYFIELNVNDANQPDLQLFFNTVPTSFSLEKEQVDRVIDTARTLLRQDPEYRRLLKNLGAYVPSH